ncbi:RHS repeat domain-containing protein [Apibacter adventoris]|uniref:RHS repeat domain-containing protein n=1 Tax=Apibacter adventoris TaxID=1679466 RepID=UPI002679274E|nr:RHS repeat-associated core domain-containing protein [Apibacter adventoris]
MFNAYFEVPYHGKDHNEYVNGAGFCYVGKDKKLQAYGGGIGKGNEEYEKMQYYYHADHLGSSSNITNLDAQIVQHVAYVPFGEVFIEERNQSWNTPYLFNGKELDGETGLYYYGARYYNPRESVWLSMDPLYIAHLDADSNTGGVYDSKNLSVYSYVHNRSVNAVDPDGEDIIILYDSNSVYGLGHSAVLIGNDKDGWRYISMNGTGEGAKPIGLAKNSDLGNIKYNRKTRIGNDFRGSGLKATEIIGIINESANPNEKHNYDRAFLILSNTSEDNLAYEKAKKEASAKWYNIFGQSCIDPGQAALKGVIEDRYGKDVPDKIGYEKIEHQLIPNNQAAMLLKQIEMLNKGLQKQGQNVIIQATEKNLKINRKKINKNEV